MRCWVARLRTALAVLATAALLYQIPATLLPMFSRRDGADAQPRQTVLLRVWLSEQWTGTAMGWLTGQAARFERENRTVRVLVRRAQRGDWALPGAVPPDILLFDAGAVGDPPALLTELADGFGVRDFLAGSGTWQGKTYAVALCYGGTALLTNPSVSTDAVARQMESEQDFQDFVGGKPIALSATLREARRLQMLCDAGGGFAYVAEPNDNATNLLLMAGLFPGTDARAAAAEAFLRHLLSGEAQDALPDWWLLPAREGPELSVPLLAAMQRAIRYAANAFD